MAKRNNWARWICLAIGYAVFGFFGAIIGYFIGSLIDNRGKVNLGQQGNGNGGYQGQSFTSSEDFNKAFVVLSAAVMRADGKVMKVELEFVKRFFIRNFGETDAKRYLLTLREVLKQDYPIEGVCEQIRQYMSKSLRLQILHYLFGIAKADGDIDTSEINVIRNIARHLGLTDREFLSLQAMFSGASYGESSSTITPKSAYTILEIDETATDDEVKKAYRKMVVKYHPDKLQHLEESHQKAGQEKFLKVQEAYERIKKSRGL